MGIDIYMRWKGQTEEEKKAQFTGFSVESGHIGYLREAYHGDPYATRVLLTEAFESENGNAQISASTLKERLPKTIEAHIERAKTVYKEDVDVNSPSAQSFVKFVELAEQKEKETGEPVTIRASY